MAAHKHLTGCQDQGGVIDLVGTGKPRLHPLPLMLDPRVGKTAGTRCDVPGSPGLSGIGAPFCSVAAVFSTTVAGAFLRHTAYHRHMPDLMIPAFLVSGDGSNRTAQITFMFQ